MLLSVSGHLVKAFAVAATLLMLLIVADQNVMKIASTDSVPLAGITDDSGNGTSPVPSVPQDPPIEQPQRDVEPGTITQSWDSASIVSETSEKGKPRQVENGTHLRYATPYGDFALSKHSPTFVSVGDFRNLSGGGIVADSAFLVLHGGVQWGTLLGPSGGKIDSAATDRLDFHYQLSLEDGTAAGVMRVTYQFFDERNKITVSFAPSTGKPEDFRIVWLTFSPWDVVNTASPADIEQRIGELPCYYGSLFLRDIGTSLCSTGGGTDFLGAMIRPHKTTDAPDGYGLRIDASDASIDFDGSYAGKLSFGGRSGNAVMVMFSSGHLSIDPQLLLSGQPQDAVAHSGVTRKTFHDGERYWFFSKLPDGKSIKYGSSVDGKTWVAGYQYVVTTSGALSNGFTVMNFGKTVGVLWIDSASPKAIQIRTGLILTDQIQWDETGHQLYLGGNDITRPPSATFTIQGRAFATTWGDSAGGVRTAVFKCTGRGTSGFSECATQASLGVDSSSATGPSYSLVVPFNGIEAVARIMVESFTGLFGDQHAKFSVKVYYIELGNCPETQIVDTGQDRRDAWIADGLFTATSVGSDINLFLRANDATIGNWVITADCTPTAAIGIAASSAVYLTAGTDQTGNASYLFYREGSSIQYVRVLPRRPQVDYVAIPAPLAAYTNPTYLTAAATARRFIPLMFTRAYPPPPGVSDSCAASYCLYYVNFPLPLDGEAAVDNPWAVKLGAPVAADDAGVVSPTTGLLAVGQVLVGGTPSISLSYREPGLFYRTGSGYDESYLGPQAHPLIPGIYYDLPWVAGTILHMQGGQQLPLILTGMSGNLRWFNNTRGVRYTLVYDTTTYRYTLTYPSGAYMWFDFISGSANEWHVSKLCPDTTGNNCVTYNVDFGITGSIVDSSGRQVTLNGFGRADSITYGNGQTIGLWDLGVPLGCTGGTSSDSGTLQITDAIGRVTKYYVCHWKLSKIESSNGGRVNYTYADSGQSQQVWQGTEVYSLPVLRMDVYNESAAGVKSRSRSFNWNFQNGLAVRALVNTTDKSGVVQGSNEYFFNSATGTASVRTYDFGGQVLHYDMQTKNGAAMKDLSGNANDGTISGPVDTIGKQGRARDFSGSNQWIESLPSLSSLSMTDYATVSLWFQHDYASFPLNDLKGLAFKGANTGLGQRNYDVYLKADGQLTMDWCNASVCDPGVSSGTSYTDRNWHHVVAVFDWAGQSFRLYVDGVLKNSGTSSNSVAVNTAKLVFGKVSESSSSTRFFDGRIDEVHVYHRALSSEDVGILFTTNALKKGEQRNWYSANDMPQLSEGFLGDQTVDPILTQGLMDDWGNEIYSRDPSGNETFASFANTNHQGHFYAPGRLTKNTGTQFSTEFIDFSNGTFPTGQGTWTVASTANPATEISYSLFDKITPSLRLYAPSSGSTVVQHTLLAASPDFIEFRARTVTDVTNAFEIRFGTSSADYAGIRFSGSRTIEVCQGSGCGSQTWTYCNPVGVPTFNYELNSWYRITIEVDYSGGNYPWRAFLNGRDLSCGSPTLAGHLLTQMSLSTSKGIASWTGGAIDDIKLYANSNGLQTGYSALDIGFDGLQPRQSIALIAADGSVIDQTMQTSTGTLRLSFNSALTGTYEYSETGDNSRTIVRIYAEDGTLEYQSPLTRFFVGERYSYTRPRTFSDELAKTRSGATYWPQYIWADENTFCSGNISCTPAGWTGSWQQSPTVRGAMRGNYVHRTTSDYVVDGISWHYFTMPKTAAPAYFVTYVRIPEGKQPLGLFLAVLDCGDVPGCASVWKEAYWGVLPVGRAPDGSSWGIQKYMGPVPTARDQWIRLEVSAGYDDLWISYYWGGIGYGLVAGEAEWDVTTTLSDASLTVSGLNSLCYACSLKVGIYDSVNNVLIASGTQNFDAAPITLHRPSSTYDWDAFPIQANIKICSSTCDGTQATEYYYGPPRNLWPGDVLLYTGQSSFFDPKSGGTAYWPGSTVHTAQLGVKTFSADCLDTVLCYDMESITDGPPPLDTGAILARLLDLSGRNNFGSLSGTIGYRPYVSTPATGAAGLGMTFAASRNSYISVADASSLKPSAFSVSIWLYPTSFPAAYTRIVAKDRRLTAPYQGWMVLYNGNVPYGRIYLAIFNTAGTEYNSPQIQLALNTINHAVFTFDGIAVRGYLNGVEVTPAGAFSGVFQTSSNPLFIGAGDSDGLNSWYDGTIDQLVLYPRTLTGKEALALYHSRLPGAPQTYLQPTNSPAGSGLIRSTRTPYEGAYLYAVATHDSKGNVRSVTDLGRTSSGGSNITSYEYSTLYSQDYLTKITRPYVAGDTGSAGRPVYYAYDFQTGVKYGTLDVDCRRSRTVFDAIGRPTQISTYDQDSSEVLHLDMETDDSAVPKDVSCAGTSDSRNGQSITMTGTSTDTGIDGQSRSFNGVSDWISGGNTANLQISTGSVSGWIRTTNAGTGYRGIVVKQNAYGMFLKDNIFGIYDWTTGLFQTTGINLADGQWHHVAFTFQSSANSGTIVYVDGVSKLVTKLTVLNQNVGLAVGAGNNPATMQWFAGSIDDVRVFNAVRSAQDIAGLWGFKYKMMSSSSAAYDDMISKIGWTSNPTWAGYQFAAATAYDGASIPRALFLDMETMRFAGIPGITDTVEDLSGNGNHATLQGTGGTPTPVTGKIGKAMNFAAGFKEHLDISYANNKLNLTGPLTIAAWVTVSGANLTNPIFSKGYASSLQYYMDIHKSGTSWYLGVELKNSAGQFVWINSTTGISLGMWTHVAFTYDGYSIKLYVNGASDASSGTIRWPLATSTYDALVGAYAVFPTPYLDGSIDELHVLPSVLTSAQVSSLYSGTDGSHFSRTYTDGLGRPVRQVVADMYGMKVQTMATVGWNDKQIYAHTSSGGYFTYTYDFAGRTLVVQTPGVASTAGISRTVVSDEARLIESIDSMGRRAYMKTDMMRRPIETGVWNPATATYGNFTYSTYNALSQVTTTKDANGQLTAVYYNSLGRPKMTVYPDGGYAVVDYDDNLRAFRTTDVMGRVATDTFDSLGRVIKSSLKASSSATATYDTFYDYDPVHDDLLVVQNGTVNGARTTGTARLTWTYDGLHRVKTEKLEVPANSPAFSGTVSYDYDPADKILNITYPVSGSPKAVYKYDTLARPTQVDYGGFKYAVLTYDSASRLDNIHYWKGTTDTLIEEKYAYDARDRITQVKVYKFGTTTKYTQLDYVYDKASEIRWSTDDMFTGGGGASNPKNVTYNYDGNGRLTYASGPFGASEASQTLKWKYDPVGNILAYSVDASTYNYNDGVSYPVWNRLDSISTLNGGLSFAYNAAGSMTCKTEGTTRTRYTHDFLQQLTQTEVGVPANCAVGAGTSTYSYFYDGIGRRVKTVDPSATSYFMYSGSKMLYSKIGTTETAYVYVGEKLLLKKEGTLDVRYYHHDASPGSVRLITYYANNIQIDAKYRYKPFGDFLVVSGSSQRFEFAQQELDASSLRLYHMGLRYYDPLVGRFIQRDPLGAGYEYANDNPISYYDPTGQIAILAVVVILIVVGVTAAALTYAFPVTRPYLDAAMTAIGFIPFFGDILSSSYFLTQDAIDCAQGRCDPVNIGLDVIGAVPGVPSAGGGARAASRIFGFLGGIGLVTRTSSRGSDVARAISRLESFKDIERSIDHLAHAAEFELGTGRRGLHALTLEAKAFAKEALMGRTGFRMLQEGDDLVIYGGRMIKREYRSSMKAVFSLSTHRVKTFYQVFDVSADIVSRGGAREFRSAEELAWFMARI